MCSYKTANLYSRRWFTVLILICLTACGKNSVETQKSPSGDTLKSIIQQRLTPKRTQQLAQLGAELEQLNTPLFQQHPMQADALLSAADQPRFDRSVARLIKQDKSNAQAYIEMAAKLFPQRQYKLTEALLTDDSLNQTDIEEAALSAGLDPARIFVATAAGTEPRITPLIHSLSLTLFEQQATTQTHLTYRVSGSTEWLDALPLFWDAAQHTLSGSIVYLQADTQYELQLTLTLANGSHEEQQFTAQTRADSPPIDEDKIYYLKDIYVDGTLDIEALGIKGSPTGWAKIVGDPNTIIRAWEEDDAAINIGDNSYILFENIQVRGGRYHAIYAYQAHHLWFSGCDVSDFGRTPHYQIDGKAYEYSDDAEPIDQDSGFYLNRSGVIVIENCNIHSPVPAANPQDSGDVRGPSAILIAANHPQPEFEGQIILRNNRFWGDDQHRFKHLIESRSGGRSWGGFIRDSAIYNNDFAYANDSLVELDGGQSNVLVYNNRFEQGFTGITATPNRAGPSYVFHNYVSRLGDQFQHSWAAISLGGYTVAPQGLNNVFENLIVSPSNGLAWQTYKGDASFWVNAVNNIIITTQDDSMTGFCLWDKAQITDSRYLNNYTFNLDLAASKDQASIHQPFIAPELLNYEQAESYSLQDGLVATSAINYMPLANFSRVEANGSILLIGAED